MNDKQERFATYYVKHWDGLKAMEQAGYDTHNKRSAQCTLRRLLGREDIKELVSKSVDAVDYDSLGEKEAAMAFCWEMITSKNQHAATFMGHFVKLKGWDKGDQEDAEAKPPTFSRMPFKPKDVSE